MPDVRSSARAFVRWYAGHPALRAVLPGIVLVVLGTAAFLGLLDGVQEQDDLTTLDQPLLEFLVGSRSGAVTAFLAALTFVTGPTVLPVIVLVSLLVWGFVRKQWWRPLLLAAAMIGSTLLSLLLKDLVGRPRPPEITMHIPGAESTASFPSGHTIGTATFMLVTAYLVTSRKRTVPYYVGWAVGAIVVTSAVALSRLYLGYHFLTDVLAATGLAIVVLGVVMSVDRLHVLKGLPPKEPEPGWHPAVTPGEKLPPPPEARR